MFPLFSYKASHSFNCAIFFLQDERCLTERLRLERTVDASRGILKEVGLGTQKQLHFYIIDVKLVFLSILLPSLLHESFVMKQRSLLMGFSVCIFVGEQFVNNFFFTVYDFFIPRHMFTNNSLLTNSS